ncbi:MAG: hemolysin III family protein [Capsulimonas sp.]|uniref:PAQR family membrane homeostasis protein TrhA n=1 Tax=Capsulimonas sp. TaxID=2494211 RepID=UPI0032631993
MAENELINTEPKKTKRVNPMREPFSGLSHGLGALLSIAALVILVALARGRPVHVVSYSIYGSTLILLYTASALYHLLRVPPRYADRLMRFDHTAIYLLIAGTYTPVCLLMLGGWRGWAILGVEYGLAVLGICATLFWKSAPDWVRVALYIIMGWLITLALARLRSSLPPGIVDWLIAGGVIYTLGAVVFALDRPHLLPGKFSAHDLWHLFVLGGSACHFVMMARFVTS